MKDQSTYEWKLCKARSKASDYLFTSHMCVKPKGIKRTAVFSISRIKGKGVSDASLYPLKIRGENQELQKTLLVKSRQCEYFRNISKWRLMQSYFRHLCFIYNNQDLIYNIFVHIFNINGLICNIYGLIYNLHCLIYDIYDLI